MSKERIKERCKREDIAIKVVRGFLEKDCDEETELYYSLETVLDLIDKQQKEIKKLTRLNSAYKANYYSKVLKEERKNKKILEGYISKDTVRAKIKEIGNEHTGSTRNALSVLQELLEE